MRNIGVWVVIGIAVIVGVAIMTAGNMGTTSHAHVRGKVVLDDSLKEFARGLDTLFVIVYDVNQPMPPYGALKKTLSADAEGAFYEFILTEDRMQVMRQGQPFPAEVRLKARLDQDGAAGADQPGDLVGEISGITKGATEVIITITKRI
jgi:hypothetical protein